MTKVATGFGINPFISQIRLGVCGLKQNPTNAKSVDRGREEGLMLVALSGSSGFGRLSM
jgi:hypothetical protein